MKMVAAAKLRKAQDAVVSARPYADYVNKMLRVVQMKNRYSTHPFFVPINPEGKELLVVVTADRGLCGSFNSSIIRYTQRHLEKNPDTDLVFLGRKGYDYFKKHPKHKILKAYTAVTDDISFHCLAEVRQDILDLYESGVYARVFVIFNEFKTAMQQNLLHKQLIPVEPYKSDDVSKLDFIYEPDEKEIINELGAKYINVELWRMLLESSAAEQGARMTAMDNATTNAGDLIDNLSLVYNRERQSQITTQIIEIASGAEATNN
jgi:F-type H+-transporting ATPase subunit gamma